MRWGTFQYGLSVSHLSVAVKEGVGLVGRADDDAHVVHGAIVFDHRELEAGGVDEHVVPAEIARQPTQPLYRPAELRDALGDRRVERRERARADDAVRGQAVAMLKAAHRLRHDRVVAPTRRRSAGIKIPLAPKPLAELCDPLALVPEAQTRAAQGRAPSSVVREVSVARQPRTQPAIEPRRGRQGLELRRRVAVRERRAPPAASNAAGGGTCQVRSASRGVVRPVARSRA